MMSWGRLKKAGCASCSAVARATLSRFRLRPPENKARVHWKTIVGSVVLLRGVVVSQLSRSSGVTKNCFFQFVFSRIIKVDASCQWASLRRAPQVCRWRRRSRRQSRRPAYPFRDQVVEFHVPRNATPPSRPRPQPPPRSSPPQAQSQEPRLKQERC